MAVSTYDEQFLTDEQKKQLKAFTDAWNRASEAGDQAGMDSAHAAAERVRAQAGYSGGADGGQYSGLGVQSAYTPSTLPSYQAQTDAVNRLYDAAQMAEISGLRSAYDANKAVLDAQRDVIPEIYQAQKNSAAAQAEIAGKNFNEYAGASGLNSGAGGQARLAMSNQLQGDLTALGNEEAAAQRELENSIAQLKIKYRNDIASAVANGEYRRAAALLEEYQREQESAVSVAGSQADENYRAWQAGITGRREDSSRESDDWARQLEMAKLQAQYGDLSGLKALGVDTSAYEAKQTGGYGGGSGGGSGGGYSGEASETGRETGVGSQGEIKLGTAASGMLGEFRPHPGNLQSRADAVGTALRNGYITAEEADYLLDMLGADKLGEYGNVRPVEGKKTK